MIHQLLFKRLNRLYFISNWLGSITWTGLPFLLYLKTGNEYMFGSLFLVNAVGDVLLSLLRGYIFIHFNLIRFIYVMYVLQAGVMVGIMVAFMQLEGMQLGAVIFGLMLLDKCVVAWFQPFESYVLNMVIRERNNQHKDFAVIGLWTRTAKFLGMGLGPIVFGYMDYYGLIIEIVGLCLCAVGLKKLDFSGFVYTKQQTDSVKLGSVLSFLVLNPYRRLLLVFSVLTAGVMAHMAVIANKQLSRLEDSHYLLSYVVTPEVATMLYSSLYWSIALVGSMVANGLILAFEKRGVSKLLRLDVSMLLVMVPFGVLIVFPQYPDALLLGMMSFTLGNGLFGNGVSAFLSKFTPKPFVGRMGPIMGLIESVMVLATFGLNWALSGKVDYVYWLLGVYSVRVGLFYYYRDYFRYYSNYTAMNPK